MSLLRFIFALNNITTPIENQEVIPMDDYLEDLWTLNESERDLFEVFDSGFENPISPDVFDSHDAFGTTSQDKTAIELSDYHDILDGLRNI
jgi:hypothetical protein